MINPVKKFLEDLNNTWLNKQYDDLHAFYDENVVMLPPGGAEPVTGVENMVDSYRQFGSMGTIHSFNMTGISTYEFDETIICHMQFDIDYEIESGRFKEKGLEIYILKETNNAYKIIWRTQINLSAENAGV